ncbi:glycosyltransferase family 4 protein [Paenalcaligenes hermetiae]|uniref:Glycosyltransferase family 4 protein n=1 Tax=Paenalcaligenes hermetiae TaxID=1157987 RepID=A0ABP9M516_9BURK
MHILFINLERGWRGGERQTLLTAVGLKEKGWSPTVLVRKDAELARRLKQAGTPVVERRSSFGAFLYLLFHCRQFDVYHAQTSAGLTWLASLRRFIKGKIVFTRRTAFPIVNENQSVTTCNVKRLQRLRWKWHQPDAFVAISQAAAADPIALGVEPYRIPSAIEYVPADTDHIIAVTDKHNLGGRYVLGTVAALSHEKDPCTTIRAIHLLWQKRRDFVFLHFGADGDASVEAKALVKELGLEDVYLFMGFEARITDIYRLFHVFVLTSRYEALGSSVLDAFLYAAPVVATRTGGLAELVTEGRGLACEVGDAQAIAEACDRILEDEPLRREMVLTALKWVQQHHSVEQMVEAYMQLYLGTLPKPDKTELVTVPEQESLLDPSEDNRPQTK